MCSIYTFRETDDGPYNIVGYVRIIITTITIWNLVLETLICIKLNSGTRR